MRLRERRPVRLSRACRRNEGGDATRPTLDQRGTTPTQTSWRQRRESTPMAAFRFRSRRTRRRWVFGVTTGVLAAALLFLIASAGATLTGSTFESGDGNLASNGAHDWDSPIQAINCTSIPAANCGNDLVRSSADNSFGQGPKEDDPAPSVGTGSIPPNKDDLRRFYVNQEHQHSVGCAPGTGTPNDCDYLYLAWERTNLLGSAHMDFEFNQDSTVGANGVTPVRTANDLLIVFDFGGSGVPDLALLRWVTSGATSQCEASNSLPCWGNKVDLTAAGFAEGAVNGTALTDNRAPGNPFALPGDSSHSTFGEAGINLTGANVFPSNVCFHLGSAFLKSRSSGQSFTSTLKDFIAPIPVNITNCGKIIIRKVTSPSPDPTNTTFNYSTTGGSHTLSPSSFGLANGGSQDFGGTAFADTYTVTEADPSPTFAFQNIDCNVAAHPSDTSHGSTTSSSGRVLTIDLKPQDTVDCTYFNNLQLGAIAITKTSSKGGAGLAGADFTVTGPLPGGTAHQ